MIQRYEYYNANIEPRSDGRIVFYADAEKWVQEEIDERDRTISRLNNDLCDRRIILQAALKLCKGKDEEIAALKTERESHAWEISPAMAQAKIDELNNAQIILRLSKIQQADNEKKATLTVCFEEKIAALKEKIDQSVIAKT